MPKEDHVYWETEGTPYTPQEKELEDMPIAKLADLVEKLMREADEKRDRTHELIAALVSSC
jgi:hypothetical protein